MPDGVAVARAQFVADVLGGELAQAGEVGGGQPVSGQDGAQHILDHERGGEQALVVLVVKHGRVRTMNTRARSLALYGPGQETGRRRGMWKRSPRRVRAAPDSIEVLATTAAANRR